jgi:hypothetical protein
MKVRQLTLEQKNQLVGQTYDGEQYFNPTLDADGNWFISNEEFFNCTTDALFGWTLPEIDYNPVISEFPI